MLVGHVIPGDYYTYTYVNDVQWYHVTGSLTKFINHHAETATLGHLLTTINTYIHIQ